MLEPPRPEHVLALLLHKLGHSQQQLWPLLRLVSEWLRQECWLLKPEFEQTTLLELLRIVDTPQ